jgi:hypothetical protein
MTEDADTGGAKDIEAHGNLIGAGLLLGGFVGLTIGALSSSFWFWFPVITVIGLGLGIALHYRK